MNAIELVDKFVQARKAEDAKYGDSVALGSTKAMLCEAIDIMDKVIKAFDHKDPMEVVANMRYPILDCKTFITYMEEKANVSH